MSWRAHKYSRPAWIAPYQTLRYARYGRGPDGYDCHGFLRHVYARECGIAVPALSTDEADVGTFDAARDVIESQGPVWQRVAMGVPAGAALTDAALRAALRAARPFDLLLLDPVVEAMHCGIYLGGGEFLHMMIGASGHVSALAHPYWRGKLLGIWRPRAVAP